MNSGTIDPRVAIAAQAAEWVVRIDEGEFQVADERALLNWLCCSPQHIDEFLVATALWRTLDGSHREQEINVEQLIARARSNIVSLKHAADSEDAETPAAPRRRRLGWAAVAATLILGTCLSFWWLKLPNSFVTSVGEQRSFTLTDGSIIYLNTASELQAKLTARGRDVTLLRGEAMFQVAKDSHRPFRVHVGPTVLQVIGTQFDVYRRPADTLVTVVEGKVSVLPVELSSNAAPSGSDAGTAYLEPTHEVVSAGQQVQIERQGKLSHVELADVSRNVAWRNRRLIFAGDPISTVAAEFNRYNRRHFVIRDAAALTRRITGTFDADDPESFVDFLQRDPSLTVLRAGNQIIISAR